MSMCWKGKRVDDMSESELRETVREMGDYIARLHESRRAEVDRTVKWVKVAADNATR